MVTRPPPGYHHVLSRQALVKLVCDAGNILRVNRRPRPGHDPTRAHPFGQSPAPPSWARSKRPLSLRARAVSARALTSPLPHDELRPRAPPGRPRLRCPIRQALQSVARNVPTRSSPHHLIDQAAQTTFHVLHNTLNKSTQALPDAQLPKLHYEPGQASPAPVLARAQKIQAVYTRPAFQ